MRTEETAPSQEEGPPQETEKTAADEKDSFVDFLKELPVLIVVAFGIALLIKTFLLQAFFIPSESMRDTLLIGDRVLVSKFMYKFSDPDPGDVVVFISPLGGVTPKQDRGPVGNFINGISEGLGLKSSERDFIKRVIAVEGQTIQIKEGSVFVDNKKIDEPYRFDQEPMPDYGPTKVGKDKVFVMGDHRLNSQDSRVFGPIPESSIIGRAFVLIWPPGRFDILSNPFK